MKTLCVKMQFTSPMHAGELGLGMEEAESTVRSDTLYSALYQTWMRLFNIENKTLPVVISSAFPFLDEQLFFPKPALEPPGFNRIEVREAFAKEVKGSRFLSQEMFNDWINGREVDYSRMQADNEKLSAAMCNVIRPRVALDRVNNNSALYFVGQVDFDYDHSGLYFLAQGEKTALEELKAAVRLLGDEGLGGLRSCGYGKFIPSFQDEPEIPQVENGNHYVNLSLYHPLSREELEGACVSYQLVKRGGWTISQQHYPQKKVIMFAEGSLFSRPVQGMLVDARHPEVEHPVYRSGQAYLLRVR